MAQQRNPEEERRARQIRAIRSFSSWTGRTQLLDTRLVEGHSDDGRAQLDLFRYPTTNFTSVPSRFTGYREGSWYLNGLLHRESGPARHRVFNENSIAQFALNGYTLTFAHFCRLLELTSEEISRIRNLCGDFRPV